MEKKWVVKYDCRGMETSEIIDTILADRGVEDMAALLYPNEDCLIPFEEMKNIKRAASIITKNIENTEYILNKQIIKTTKQLIKIE